ncbi:MAG: hypothetical protein FVQ79_07460 [Planctomycetes bacterium]|nr:hypothetical protein [Planctomycetota bacterium]
MENHENNTGVKDVSMENLFGQSIQNQKPQTLKEFVDQIFSGENHRLKTNLKQRQVMKLVRLMVFAERYNSQVCRDLELFVTDYLISINAMGRGDLKEALKAYVRGEMQEQDGLRQQRSLMQRLLGR